jgi:hypothetical protein
MHESNVSLTVIATEGNGITALPRRILDVPRSSSAAYVQYKSNYCEIRFED